MNSFILFFALLFGNGCSISNKQPLIQHVTGTQKAGSNEIWLTHEHILVDFVGADSIRPNSWNHETVIKEELPFLEDLKEFKVNYFVDATPNYLRRDVLLLKEIAYRTSLRIVTNTGLYGVRNNKFIPEYAREMTAENLAGMWISEFENGIDGTSIQSI